jgi:hypothetical protein
MRDHFTSIEEVETILSARFSELIAPPYFVDRPQEAELKFIAYSIFPSPGWGVIQAGTSLAERTEAAVKLSGAMFPSARMHFVVL